MSFLLRRNLPLAWAGWRDSFDRPAESPVRQPWVHLGDGTAADIDGQKLLHIPSNFSTINGGGPSYEFQPFTPNSGFECTLWFPVEGLAAQAFSIYLTDSWTRIGATFRNCLGIRLMHAPVNGGDTIQVCEFSDVLAVSGVRAQWPSPVAYYGSWVLVKIWIDADERVTVWLNDSLVGTASISPGFRLGPNRRSIRFLNTALCDAWLGRIDHYDRNSQASSS